MKMNSNPGKFKLINALLNTINLDHGIELFIKSDFPFSSGLGGSFSNLCFYIGLFQ